MFNSFNIFDVGFPHHRLMTLHENHMKKLKDKATYIQTVNFKQVSEFEEKS